MRVLTHIWAHSTVTDLKLDNIMVGFEDPSVLEDFSPAQPNSPMPRKIRDGRAVYLSHNDFGSLRSTYVLPKIADFGLAQHGSNEVQRHPIQSDHYRAHEVILGAGWTYSVDVWSLGVLVCLQFHILCHVLIRS
jgi:serine/threonine protein kinase